MIHGKTRTLAGVPEVRHRFVRVLLAPLRGAIYSTW